MGILLPEQSYSRIKISAVNGRQGPMVGGGTPPSDENWMPQHSFREHSKGGLSPILRCEWAAIPAVEIGIAVGARSTGSRGLIEERRNQVYSEPPHY